MPGFSSNSLAKLETCHPSLIQLAKWAIQYYDFSVVDGHRDKLRQERYFQSKVSKVRWPNSKHNLLPSLAFDVYPFHPKYKSLTEDPVVVGRITAASGCTPAQALAFIREEYQRLAAVMFVGAQILQIPIRWGGDWDGDLDRFDQTFHDLAHFEIVSEGASTQSGD